MTRMLKRQRGDCASHLRGGEGPAAAAASLVPHGMDKLRPLGSSVEGRREVVDGSGGVDGAGDVLVGRGRGHTEQAHGLLARNTVESGGHFSRPRRMWVAVDAGNDVWIEHGEVEDGCGAG